MAPAPLRSPPSDGRLWTSACPTTTVRRLIGSLQPDLVVSHEEYSALAAAAIFGKRALLLTDFFSDGGSFWMQGQWFAERILFLWRGVHPEPPSAKGCTVYLGPALREFAWRRSDRFRARRELGAGPKRAPPWRRWLLRIT